MKDNDTVCCTF